MGTVRPQGVRLVLGVGLALAATGAMAAPSSAMTLPAPDPAPAPIPAPVPAPVPAPTPPSPAPKPESTRTLLLPRGDGRRIVVGWPSGYRSVAPELTVPVRISQPARGQRRLTLSLLRVSSKGRVLGAVQRKRLTRGTVSVAIPKGYGRRYALRLQRGGKLLRQMTIRTPAAVPMPDARRPGTDGTVNPPACPPGTPAGQIVLAAPSVEAGQLLAFTVHNSGSTCIERIGLHRVERQDEHGAWVPVEIQNLPQTAIYYTVPPGGRDRMMFGLPSGALPGLHRLVVTLVTVPSNGLPVAPPTDTAEITVDFQVTAPAPVS